jgi:hypothetical protein
LSAGLDSAGAMPETSAPRPATAPSEPRPVAAVETAEPVAAPVMAAVPAEDDAPWPVDESSEAAFRAEARARGEPVASPELPAAEEEPPKASLPPLEKLVSQIPGEVREMLEDLFRARFVSVKHIPKKALKQ